MRGLFTIKPAGAQAPRSPWLAALLLLAPAAAAAALALLLSTEFLFQPFVWRAYAPADVLHAWVGILRDRLIVALPIALALAAAWVPMVTRFRSATLLRLIAVVIGAATGEILLYLIGPENQARDVLAVVGETVRWSLVAAAVTLLLFVWRSAIGTEVVAREAAADVARLRRLAAASRIAALQRQIEPHFLFNTLATIRSLQSEDPTRGRHLLRQLLTLVSRTLGASHGGPATLGGEIELTGAYLDVCRARLGGALDVRYEVADALLTRAVPALALSTLVENAIKHGIGPRNGGAIVIRATASQGGLLVDVSDDGVGLSDKAGGGGIGLANIAERLRLAYGPRARLELRANPHRGVCASFWLPDPASAPC